VAAAQQGHQQGLHQPVLADDYLRDGSLHLTEASGRTINLVRELLIFHTSPDGQLAREIWSKDHACLCDRINPRMGRRIGRTGVRSAFSPDPVPVPDDR
jgi:hypothetical protein